MLATHSSLVHTIMDSLVSHCSFTISTVHPSCSKCQNLRAFYSSILPMIVAYDSNAGGMSSFIIRFAQYDKLRILEKMY